MVIITISQSDENSFSMKGSKDIQSYKLEYTLREIPW